MPLNVNIEDTGVIIVENGIADLAVPLLCHGESRSMKS